MLVGVHYQSAHLEWRRLSWRSAKRGILIMNCAVLLASIFPGVQIADLDKSVVYEVPKSMESTQSWSRRQAAKACAYKNGIRWRIVQG
jgi:hypothetical protein